jgi:hypothetical protein
MQLLVVPVAAIAYDDRGKGKDTAGNLDCLVEFGQNQTVAP